MKEFRDLADELSEYWQEQVGEEVRAVVHFNRDEYEPAYLRDDVSKQLALEDGTMSMFRHPAVQLDTAIRKLGTLASTLGTPEYAILNFGDVTLFFLPLMRKRGVIITLDSEGKVPESLITGSMEIRDEHL